MNEAEWLVHDVRAALGELEREIGQGEDQARQVQELADGEAS